MKGYGYGRGLNCSAVAELPCRCAFINDHEVSMSNEKSQHITALQLYRLLTFKSNDQLAVCQTFGAQHLEKLTDKQAFQGLKYCIHARNARKRQHVPFFSPDDGYWKSKGMEQVS